MPNGAFRDGLLQRIVREAGVPDLLEALTERVSPTDLQSLLLEVYRRRGARVSAPALLRQYERSRFVRLASISPEESLEFDRLAYSLLPDGFEAIELSPVSPLGTCSALATVDQNRAVSTIRNTEVCADSTNVLALECASRRRALGSGKDLPDTKLCASHRLLRAQAFEGPGMFAHFRVFSLCTSGRDRGRRRFEIGALREQLDFYVRLLLASRDMGFTVGSIRVTMTPFVGADASVLERDIMTPLATKHREVVFRLDMERRSGRGYYDWAAFQIGAVDAADIEHSLADGGFTDWTARLMSNGKERLLISGIGTERFVACFGRPTRPQHFVR